ncbi:hypothetical protein OG225_41385 (plasmid) [Nocardia sp. NBC_01377]|uniref:hypothetical protein n=1 Tax=Nocardia sp. NBC_01377 TaxID=2903595 RepID=UPI002F90810E
MLSNIVGARTILTALTASGVIAAFLAIGAAAQANAFAWPHETCDARTYYPDSHSDYKFTFDHSDGKTKYFQVWNTDLGYDLPRVLGLEDGNHENWASCR